MTVRFWPILELDEGATETDVRRAYATRLREQGLDADVVRFQALRAEFEAALAAARAPRSFALKGTAGFDDRLPARSGTQTIPARETTVSDDIDRLLREGNLEAACERFDLARASNEIDFGAESEIEVRLAHAWLVNATLDDSALRAIVRRYRWDDAVSGFPLGPQVVARLHAAAPRPGARFAGKWNWGAFMLAPFWLIAHGLTFRGIRLLVVGTLLLALPFGPLALLGIAIRFGRRGNAIAIQRRTFTSDEQFAAVQKAWAVRGLLIVPMTLIAAFLVLVAVLATTHVR